MGALVSEEQVGPRSNLGLRDAFWDVDAFHFYQQPVMQGFLADHILPAGGRSLVVIEAHRTDQDLLLQRLEGRSEVRVVETLGCGPAQLTCDLRQDSDVDALHVVVSVENLAQIEGLMARIEEGETAQAFEHAQQAVGHASGPSENVLPSWSFEMLRAFFQWFRPQTHEGSCFFLWVPACDVLSHAQSKDGYASEEKMAGHVRLVGSLMYEDL